LRTFGKMDYELLYGGLEFISALMTSGAGIAISRTLENPIAMGMGMLLVFEGVEDMARGEPGYFIRRGLEKITKRVRQ